jgi:glycosyltransferase involved in cell wall biosynthesis
MRIAMVGPFGFHPNKTMRARAFQLARPLADQGHEIAMFMPPWQTPAEAGRVWEEDGVEIHYVNLKGGLPFIWRRLVQETLAFRPDVVHCFKPKAYSGLVAWWLWHRRRQTIRLVTDTDDWEGWGGWNELAPYNVVQKHFFARQERWGLGHCHVLTVASRALQSLAGTHAVSPEQVVYLPNGPGIDINAEGAGNRRQELGLTDRPVLLLYSRLFEFDTGRLLDVLQRVHTRVPHLAILSIGSGLYAEDAESLRVGLAERGLLPAVVDLGWLDEEDLPAAIQSADVGLYLMEDTLLNRTKCPVKLADMAALGLPVVAEDVGQVREYVQHERTGMLSTVGDPAGLAEQIVQLLTDDARRRQMGAAARDYLRRFSWTNLAEQLLTAYQG